MKCSRQLTENIPNGSIIPNWIYYPQLAILSPIGDILSDWGLVIRSLTLRYQTHISPILNWIYYPQLRILDPQLRIRSLQLGI